MNFQGSYIKIKIVKNFVMPVAILPDISEQMCIGCALCVEICTTLGPDVLRVKPVEGWKRGKGIRVLSREMYYRWCMHRCMPNKSNLLDETNGLYRWTTSSTP